jgi:fluoroquinolone resistance protein
MEKIQEDQTIKNIDFTKEELSGNEFDNCEFINCNFSKSDLNNINFIDCSFTDSNLSLATVSNTGIKNVEFIRCKLMGIDFSVSNDFLFSASFTDCQLDYCIFYKKKLKKAIFSGCSLKEVDFTESDLSAAAFINCDLANATFLQTNLEKADFRKATNYAFDPELNKIKKAKFSHADIAGLLRKYNIEIE